jgi:hypothetical protein
MWCGIVASDKVAGTDRYIGGEQRRRIRICPWHSNRSGYKMLWITKSKHARGYAARSRLQNHGNRLDDVSLRGRQLFRPVLGEHARDCAECHSADGKGAGSEKRLLRGYRSVDLTPLSKTNGRRFHVRRSTKPLMAVSGSWRTFRAIGRDGECCIVRGEEKEGSSGTNQQVNRRISALGDFVELLQEKLMLESARAFRRQSPIHSC